MSYVVTQGQHINRNTDKKKKKKDHKNDHPFFSNLGLVTRGRKKKKYIQ